MEYTSGYKTAQRWDVSVTAVYRAAREGRIPGAELVNGYWRIPTNAEAPMKKIIAPNPGHISVREAAEKWGITMESVRDAAKAGRIPGAEFIGGRWHIPNDLEGPVDGRKKRS